MPRKLLLLLLSILTVFTVVACDDMTTTTTTSNTTVTTTTTAVPVRRAASLPCSNPHRSSASGCRIRRRPIPSGCAGRPLRSQAVGSTPAVPRSCDRP